MTTGTGFHMVLQGPPSVIIPKNPQQFWFDDNAYKYVRLIWLNYFLQVDDLLQKYEALKEKYVANRNSTKEKLTE